jgi:hypothetical protein
MTASGHINLVPGTAALVNSGGTMWRLRSLVAMGHDASRIARALAVHPQTIQKILRGDAESVSAQLRDRASRLWDAWWDKRPPEQTCGQRRIADTARRQAKRLGWCPPLGLDEDQLDEPGYRPYSRYRAATGTGTAGEFRVVTASGPRATARSVHRRHSQPAARSLPLRSSGASLPACDDGGVQT